MPDPIFVYGTLKRGERNHRSHASGVTRIVRASVRGTLFHLPAGYPGFRADGGREVFGELLHFPDPADALTRFDTLEDYREDDPAGSLYHRVLCDAQPLDHGRGPLPGRVLDEDRPHADLEPAVAARPAHGPPALRSVLGAQRLVDAVEPRRVELDALDALDAHPCAHPGSSASGTAS